MNKQISKEKERLLLAQLIKEEIECQEFTADDLEPFIFDGVPTGRCRIVGYSCKEHIECGAKFREAAKKFSSCDRRKEIKNEVEKVDLKTAADNGYLKKMLIMICKWENFVEIFTFCCDLVIKGISAKISGATKKIIFDLLFQSVNEWVEKHGGWVKVLKDDATSWMFVGGAAAVVVGIVAIIVAMSVKKKV